MNSEILDRMPPANLDAERQVLGSVFLQPKILDDAAGMLSAADFYADSHRKIFAELLVISENDSNIDMALFVDHLRQNGKLESVGGAAGLLEISNAVGVHNHWRKHAKIVLRESKRRQITHAAIELLRTVWDDLPEDSLSKAEEAFGAIRTGDYDSEPRSMDVAAVEALAELEEILAGKRRAGFMVGLPEFDQRIGGVFGGELTVLAARPSQGKTSLALQMAAHIASRGWKVYFATLEMDRKELAMKRLCSVAGVSQQAVRAGDVTDEQKRRLVRAGSEVGVKNFLLHDWPEIRPYDIQRAARRFGADCIFADYLQYISPPDASKQRYEQVGQISRQLKTIARRMEIPVIACAQIGRQAENQAENRPKLSHLRESGNIENDADMALLLWRPEGGIGDDHNRWDAEIEVAKNRKGIRGKFRLDWDGNATTFSCHSRSGDWTAESAFE